MIWYSYKGVPYTGNAPAYYDLSSDQWFAGLKKNMPQIRELTLQYLQQQGIEVDDYFNQELVSGKKPWKISPFLFWGKRSEQNIEKGKELFAMFESIPSLTGLAISILPPSTSVKPHYGDTDAVYRIHIPIKIPADLPVCGLKVDGIEKSWQSDEPLVFCDAHLHEAWNHSSEVRIVVIADVVRPEFYTNTKNICSNVLSLLELQKLMAKFPALNALPWFVKGGLRFLIKTLILLRKQTPPAPAFSV